MKRHVSALVLALAIGACGGKLADDESVGTVVPGTATRDAGSSTPTTPANIAELPGLVLWLESTKGVLVTDGRVKNWLDQSPEHNNLAVFEGSGATMTKSIANVPTVAFDGASSYSLPFDTPLDDWSGDFLVEVVVRANQSPELQFILSCGGTPPNVPGFTQASFYLEDDQTSSCTVDSDGYTNESKTKSLGNDPVLVGYRRSGAKLEARRNGVVDKSDSLEQETAPSCSKTIFGAHLEEDLTHDDSFLASEIAEVVVVHGATDDATVTKIEQTLVGKYEIH